MYLHHMSSLNTFSLISSYINNYFCACIIINRVVQPIQLYMKYTHFHEGMMSSNALVYRGDMKQYAIVLHFCHLLLCTSAYSYVCIYDFSCAGNSRSMVVN